VSASFRARRYTAQDGLSLFFRDYPGPATGAGTPVLCLGGLSRNSKDFADMAARLSASRRVICPDYRGRGRSDYARDWRTYHPRHYLADLLQLLIVARLHRFVCIGTSMGGLLAMGLSAAAPTALAGAVLNDIGPEFGAGSLAKIFAYVGHDAPQPDLESADAFLRDAFPEIAFRDDRTWRRFAEASFVQGPDGLWHVDWDTAIVQPLKHAQAETPDLWKLFAGLGRLPVLAIRGETSTVLPVETLRAMETRHPGLRSLTVAGLGHTPSLEEAECVEAIDDYLDAVDREPDIAWRFG
jgi:pimeloyl-ACP methyl ester carboxylesterase